MVTVTEINYKNFGKCVKLENEVASVIVTVEVGPRIISYCLNGKENILLEDVDREFQDGGERLKEFFGEDKTWYIYGGHRLWASPESYPHSYVPDNEPVQYEININSINIEAPDTRTGQRHNTSVTLDETTSKVTITHVIENVSGSIVTLAPWALTVCAAGGVEIFPQNQAVNGLLSNRRCVFWSYSDLKDDRFFLTNKYGTLRQVKGAPTKFKIGINNEDGWAAVVNKGQVFLKNFRMNKNGEYPDYGCNFETFTNGIFLECESLGELKQLKNGDCVFMSETWMLEECSDTFDPKDEESIDAFVKKYDLRFRLDDDSKSCTAHTVMTHVVEI